MGANYALLSSLAGAQKKRGGELKFIKPCKPQQNAFIGRFNHTYRHEVLNANIFESLEQFEILPKNGATTRNALMQHSGSSHRYTIENKKKNSL
jgi:transposase InsO family protein